MSKYRVASVQWIDVYADSAEEAQAVAGQIYNDASDDEREAFPSFVLAWDHDGGPIDNEDAVALAVEAQWDEWSPNNDPF